MTRTNYTPLQRKAMAHNSLIGLAVAIQKNAKTIRDAATTGSRAQAWAETIVNTAVTLEQALRAERKD